MAAVARALLWSTGVTLDLFASANISAQPNRAQRFADGAWRFPGAALPHVTALMADVAAVTQQAPPRTMRTPSGLAMSAQMTNCGTWGWYSDARGYRYERRDPLTNLAWPPLPTGFAQLATQWAAEAGYPGFAPDAAIINHYAVGAKMTLHQDLNERDTEWPIVSISLGLPAVFLFGGSTRRAPTQKLRLEHGDVVVWGGPSRMNFHGVLPIGPGFHPLTGATRINVTLRRAG